MIFLNNNDLLYMLELSGNAYSEQHSSINGVRTIQVDSLRTRILGIISTKQHSITEYYGKMLQRLK